MTTRLLIVQPYIPEYRAPFFRDLRKALTTMGVELVVAAGIPHGGLALRGDDSHDEVDVQLDEWGTTLAGRRINVRRLESVMRQFKPHFVIAEQAIKNFETYPLLVRQSLGGPRVALWGHGRSYSTKQSRIEAVLKQWVTRRADWFFAYTELGAKFVVEHGFPAGRVTVVNNTIDTAELAADLEAVTHNAIDSFRDRLGLTAGRTALFIGGVDAAKGIDFLIESVTRLSEQVHDFRLLVAGDGARRTDIQRLEANGGPFRYLGRVKGREKAIALKAADVLLIPEWVGLVAVDSLVAGRPIITTNYPTHSPEFEYLRNGENAIVTNHSVPSYARATEALLGNPEFLLFLQGNARRDAEARSMTHMVRNVAEGIQSWTRSVV